MRYVWLFLLGLLSGLVQAQDADGLRLIQAQAELPTLTLWANLPLDSVIERTQFDISVGEHPARVFGIDSFEQSGEGVGYIFLVDISKSLRSRHLLQIKRALYHWLDGMREHDRAALITFGHEVKHDLEFTADRFKLSNAVSMLAITDMETSLYHALLEAISLGRARGGDLPARRAIVVLSDGIDDSVAGVSLDDVSRQIREYRVPIYSIGFAVEPINDRKRDGLKVLGMLSRESGGYFARADEYHLDNAYEQQHQRITQAYRLRIDCPDCDASGRLQRINVTWSDGRRTLSDGMDMRLLAKHAVTRSHPRDNGKDNGGRSILIFASALLVFLGGLLWLYRRRLAWAPEPESVHNSESENTSAQAPQTKAALSIRLTVVAGIQKGKVHQLKIIDRATLGRAANCDLTLDDDVEISGQHAMLQWLAGKLIVRDLNSTNGTLVNGVPIHNDYPLRNGDLLLLGRTELRIEFSGQS